MPHSSLLWLVAFSDGFVTTYACQRTLTLRMKVHFSLDHSTIRIVLYWAVVALSTTRRTEAACTVVTVGLLTMDFSINPTRDGTQTQKEPLALTRCAGREPTATMTIKTAAKIAKRRIGRSSGGRYGGCVMAVPQNFQEYTGARSEPNVMTRNPPETNRFAGHSRTECPFKDHPCPEMDRRF